MHFVGQCVHDQRQLIAKVSPSGRLLRSTRTGGFNLDPKSELAKVGLEVLPVKEVYTDLAKPATRQVGQALGRVGALLNSAIRPLQTLQLTCDLLFDRLDGWIRKELESAPSEELQEPPAIVVGSVLPGLLFAQDEPELRRLFVRLLGTSMLRSKSRKAHPAFAELIKQMTPVEARLISSMKDGGSVPFLWIRSCVPRPGRDYSHWKDCHPTMTLEELEDLAVHHMGEYWEDDAIWSLHDIAGFAEHAPLLASLENLQRLSLIEISKDTVIEGDGAESYLTVARSDAVIKHIADLRGRGYLPWVRQGELHLTAYGKLFVEACVPEAV